jgi:hypothetical protein|tara:strand:- start:97 stop:645 length:549 start_codon:yes stop_codon:yes gene_type:complete
MTLDLIFASNVYTKFKAPNSDEIMDAVDLHVQLDNFDDYKFEWGKRCDVNRILLKHEDFIDLYKPSLDVFADIIGAKFNFTIYNPWINLYKFGQHQEVHDHCGSDLSCVFFMNDGDEFYFYDRNSTSLTHSIKDLIGYKNTYGIESKAGDIMFFPSHMLHGVSPIKNDATRITMSVNFDINK